MREKNKSGWNSEQEEEQESLVIEGRNTVLEAFRSIG